MGPKNAEDRDLASSIVAAGDSAVIVRLGTDISLATHARVMELLRGLDLAAPLPGVLDLVPAYASVMVRFDPLLTAYADIERQLRLILATSRPRVRATRRGRLVRVPVEYGGAAGPDLEEVAKLSGLSPDEVVHRHSNAEYRVYFLGFQAGFPYLGGLPPELAVPRLDRPRSEVPAGSVGVAGRQTGIYPVSAPGGWRLIGRTSLRLFDSAVNPPALLRPGDLIKFEPLSPAAAEIPADTPTYRISSVTRENADTGIPWLTVLRPGPQASVQDLGRYGYARYGVSASGAADTDALRMGNALLQNPPGAAALELTLGSGEFEVMAPCLVALTGAECDAAYAGKPLPLYRPVPLQAGDRLQLGPALRGVRVYLCVQGGVQIESVLGSHSTDIRAGLGGTQGRALRPGDSLRRGLSPAPEGGAVDLAVLPSRDHRPPADGEWVIRVLPGPQCSPPPTGSPLPGIYSVDPFSDRVGVRLRPLASSCETLISRPPEMISEGVSRGAVQVLPGGELVILLADHQTTGGYPVRAVVASVDMWRVAQLRPGDRVRFDRISLRSAVQLLGSFQERLRDSRTAPTAGSIFAPVAPARLEPGVEERLMRGFLEWSDEDDGRG